MPRFAPRHTKFFNRKRVDRSQSDYSDCSTATLYSQSSHGLTWLDEPMSPKPPLTRGQPRDYKNELYSPYIDTTMSPQELSRFLSEEQERSAKAVDEHMRNARRVRLLESLVALEHLNYETRVSQREQRTLPPHPQTRATVGPAAAKAAAATRELTACQRKLAGKEKIDTGRFYMQDYSNVSGPPPKEATAAFAGLYFPPHMV